MRQICVGARVSSKWKKVLSTSQLWESVDLSFCSPLAVTDSVVSQLVKAHPNQLRRLNLRFCSKVGAASFQALSEHAAELKELVLEGCGRHIDDSCLSKLSRGCEQLQSVTLYGCNTVTVYGIQQLALRCKQLETIALSNATDQMIGVLATGADRLHTVRLNGSSVSSKMRCRLPWLNGGCDCADRLCMVCGDVQMRV